MRKPRRNTGKEWPMRSSDTESEIFSARSLPSANSAASNKDVAKHGDPNRHAPPKRTPSQKRNHRRFDWARVPAERRDSLEFAFRTSADLPLGVRSGSISVEDNPLIKGFLLEKDARRVIHEFDQMSDQTHMSKAKIIAARDQSMLGASHRRPTDPGMGQKDIASELSDSEFEDIELVQELGFKVEEEDDLGRRHFRTHWLQLSPYEMKKAHYLLIKKGEILYFDGEGQRRPLQNTEIHRSPPSDDLRPAFVALWDFSSSLQRQHAKTIAMLRTATATLQEYVQETIPTTPEWMAEEPDAGGFGLQYRLRMQKIEIDRLESEVSRLQIENEFLQTAAKSSKAKQDLRLNSDSEGQLKTTDSDVPKQKFGTDSTIETLADSASEIDKLKQTGRYENALKQLALARQRQYDAETALRVAAIDHARLKAEKAELQKQLSVGSEQREQHARDALEELKVKYNHVRQQRAHLESLCLQNLDCLRRANQWQTSQQKSLQLHFEQERMDACQRLKGDSTSPLHGPTEQQKLEDSKSLPSTTTIEHLRHRGEHVAADKLEEMRSQRMQGTDFASHPEDINAKVSQGNNVDPVKPSKRRPNPIQPPAAPSDRLPQVSRLPQQAEKEQCDDILPLRASLHLTEGNSPPTEIRNPDVIPIEARNTQTPKIPHSEVTASTRVSAIDGIPLIEKTVADIKSSESKSHETSYQRSRGCGLYLSDPSGDTSANLVNAAADGFKAKDSIHGRSRETDLAQDDSAMNAIRQNFGFACVYKWTKNTQLANTDPDDGVKLVEVVDIKVDSVAIRTISPLTLSDPNECAPVQYIPPDELDWRYPRLRAAKLKADNPEMLPPSLLLLNHTVSETSKQWNCLYREKKHIKSHDSSELSLREFDLWPRFDKILDRHIREIQRRQHADRQLSDASLVFQPSAPPPDLQILGPKNWDWFVTVIRDTVARPQMGILQPGKYVITNFEPEARAPEHIVCYSVDNRNGRPCGVHKAAINLDSCGLPMYLAKTDLHMNHQNVIVLKANAVSEEAGTLKRALLCSLPDMSKRWLWEDDLKLDMGSMKIYAYSYLVNRGWMHAGIFPDDEQAYGGRGNPDYDDVEHSMVNDVNPSDSTVSHVEGKTQPEALLAGTRMNKVPSAVADADSKEGARTTIVPQKPANHDSLHKPISETLRNSTGRNLSENLDRLVRMPSPDSLDHTPEPRCSLAQRASAAKLDKQHQCTNDGVTITPEVNDGTSRIVRNQANAIWTSPRANGDTASKHLAEREVGIEALDQRLEQSVTDLLQPQFPVVSNTPPTALSHRANNKISQKSVSGDTKHVQYHQLTVHSQIPASSIESNTPNNASADIDQAQNELFPEALQQSQMAGLGHLQTRIEQHSRLSRQREVESKPRLSGSFPGLNVGAKSAVKRHRPEKSRAHRNLSMIVHLTPTSVTDRERQETSKQAESSTEGHEFKGSAPEWNYLSPSLFCNLRIKPWSIQPGYRRRIPGVRTLQLSRVSKTARSSWLNIGRGPPSLQEANDAFDVTIDPKQMEKEDKSLISAPCQNRVNGPILATPRDQKQIDRASQPSERLTPPYQPPALLDEIMQQHKEARAIIENLEEAPKQDWSPELLGELDGRPHTWEKYHNLWQLPSEEMDFTNSIEQTELSNYIRDSASSFSGSDVANITQQQDYNAHIKGNMVIGPWLTQSDSTGSVEDGVRNPQRLSSVTTEAEDAFSDQQVVISLPEGTRHAKPISASSRNSTPRASNSSTSIISLLDIFESSAGLAGREMFFISPIADWVNQGNPPKTVMNFPRGKERDSKNSQVTGWRSDPRYVQTKTSPSRNVNKHSSNTQTIPHGFLLSMPPGTEGKEKNQFSRITVNASLSEKPVDPAIAMSNERLGMSGVLQNVNMRATPNSDSEFDLCPAKTVMMPAIQKVHLSLSASQWTVAALCLTDSLLHAASFYDTRCGGNPWKRVAVYSSIFLLMTAVQASVNAFETGKAKPSNIATCIEMSVQAMQASPSEVVFRLLTQFPWLLISALTFITSITRRLSETVENRAQSKSGRITILELLQAKSAMVWHSRGKIISVGQVIYLGGLLYLLLGIYLLREEWAESNGLNRGVRLVSSRHGDYAGYGWEWRYWEMPGWRVLAQGLA